MPGHTSHDEFFTSLTSLLTTTSQKSRGSVYLTQKPLPSTTNAADSSESAPQTSPSILIRATDGNTSAPPPKSKSADQKSKQDKSKKVKVSTVVAPEELEAFYARYAEVCKGGMSGLKKRDRKKGKAKGKVAKA